MAAKKTKRTPPPAPGSRADLEKRLRSTARQMQDCITRCQQMERRALEWEYACQRAHGALTDGFPHSITPDDLMNEATAVRQALKDAGVVADKASDGIRELHRDLRAHVVRSADPIEVELGRRKGHLFSDMPAIFTDAPLARDADANQAAPTIPLSMYESLFPRINKLDASPENLGEARDYPPWCALAVLSSFEEKDRGRLLSFQLVGEDAQRVMWVRA